MQKNNGTLLNIASVAFIQGGNYALALCLMIILAKTLGVSGYGEFSYVNSVTQYFVIFVDWGFSLSATRAISLNRNDRHIFSEVFWSTVIARLILCFVGYFVLEIICWFFEQPPLLYRCAYLAVVGTALTPLFFYVGIERLVKFSVLTTLVKFISLPLVGITVLGEHDIVWAIFIPAFFNATSSILSFIHLVRSGDIDPPSLDITNVISALRNSAALFLSTASVSLYTNTNVIVLGVVSGPQAVGYFSSALLIIRAVQGIYQPISQVFFSKISHAFCHEVKRGVEIFQKLLLLQSAGVLLVSTLVFFIGPSFIILILGQSFETAEELVRWLSLTIFLVGLSNAFGVQGLVPLGYNTQFSRILLLSGMFNIILVIPMAYIWGAEGAAAAVVVTEFLITIFMGAVLYQKSPDLFWEKG